jgi:glutathione S-transferase
VICLRAKAVDFKVTYIDLRNKPDWFLAISPHGKVPVLSIDDKPLFESNAIAEFLDETVSPPLHPQDPVKRARNRAWTDFVPDFSAAISGVNYSKSPEELGQALEVARQRLARVEEALGERGNDGPFFNGLKHGLLDDLPRVKAWSEALLADERVTGSVSEEFPDAFKTMLHRRGAHAAPLFDAA